MEYGIGKCVMLVMKMTPNGRNGITKSRKKLEHWKKIKPRLIGQVGRVFDNGPRDLSSIPGRVIPKTWKMVLDYSLLNTQKYKVRIKGKMEQSRERSSCPPRNLGVVAIEKGAFCSPSTKGRQLYCTDTWGYCKLTPSDKRWCPWCSRYRRRKWTRRHEFKSWTRLIAFHIALIPLGKVWIQLFSLQLWVNSRTD